MMEDLGSSVSTNEIFQQISSAEFDIIAQITKDVAGIKLTKTTRTLVQLRLLHRMKYLNIFSFADYITLIKQDIQERDHIVQSFTTNYTHFFRENHHYDHFIEHVLPVLKTKASTGGSVNVWSAGSSSGEEIYSLAMTMAGQESCYDDWLFNGTVSLLATDISLAMVHALQAATYSISAIDSIPIGYQNKWIEKSEHSGRVIEPLRLLVKSNVLNLLNEWPMKCKYDVIFCRNTLMYFDDATKEELHMRFFDFLLPNGILYLGHSERLIGKAELLFNKIGKTTFQKINAS